MVLTIVRGAALNSGSALVTVAGNGPKTRAVTLPGTGGFALEVGGTSPLAPPVLQLNQPLVVATQTLWFTPLGFA